VTTPASHSRTHHTQQKLIDRAAKFKLHAPLTTGEMLTAESRLYAPAIFDWAEVAPRRQITTQTTEDVLVKVHERVEAR